MLLVSYKVDSTMQPKSQDGSLNVIEIEKCIAEFTIKYCKKRKNEKFTIILIFSYDEGSGSAIEVVPPCHRNSEPLR